MAAWTVDPAWKIRCGAKLAAPAAAVRRIEPGDAIYLSAGSAVPQGLFPALCDEHAQLGDNVIHHLLTLGPAPYAEARFAARFRHNALFIGPNVRPAVVEGRADYTPVFLSELPALIRAKRILVDVAIVACSPPDRDGWMTFGTHVDLAPAACDAARLILACVNPQMPRTRGPCRLHVDQTAAIVETDHPLPELPHRAPRPETDEISRHVAALVPDGATLQLGIGAIPDGVARLLAGRTDLGIHTEMFSDGVRELAQAGVVTNARKPLHAGVSIASFVLASRTTYDWLHENDAVELHPSDYTNDPGTIARHENFVALNTCLQVDLTGQVCSDSLGDRFYSGIGGQIDFIRGAARSRGGRPIIALPSTAASGVISRIVPRLDDGAGVVTTRGDVHWVVTEFGAVNLHGLNVRERALALISIAHPRFRPWLTAEAKSRRLVYADQIEPPLAAPRYPIELETRIRSLDGAALLLRPVKPTDERLLQQLFYRLSTDSVYHRFFHSRRTLPHREMQLFCTIDYDRDMAIVALPEDSSTDQVVGWASYHLDPATGLAETAFLVDDGWQGRGVGTALRTHLTSIARSRHVRGLRAEVLAGNARMLKLFEESGYPVEMIRNDDSFSIRIDLS